MFHKHENVSVCVYWDDVGVPGWKLSGWWNTRATVSSKNCEKYSRITLGVARYLHSYWDRRADAGCCVTPCAGTRATAKEWGTYAAMYNYYHSNFPRISKTAMRKPANEEGIVYCIIRFPVAPVMIWKDDPWRKTAVNVFLVTVCESCPVQPGLWRVRTVTPVEYLHYRDRTWLMLASLDLLIQTFHILL
jgi:hypothetical protein